MGFAATSDDFDRLFVRLGDGTVRPLELPYSSATAVNRWMDASVTMIAATPVTEPAVLRVDLGEKSEVVEAVELPTPRELGSTRRSGRRRSRSSTRPPAAGRRTDG